MRLSNLFIILFVFGLDTVVVAQDTGGRLAREQELAEYGKRDRTLREIERLQRERYSDDSRIERESTRIDRERARVDREQERIARERERDRNAEVDRGQRELDRIAREQSRHLRERERFERERR